MSVTGVGPTPRELLLSQVYKVTSSNVLRGSESLCRLLRYLAEQSLEHPGGLIKEYQIAIDVLGRSTNFDPRLDSTVRVQTGRLRSKLAEYYAVEGAEDRFLLELPRGSYSLGLHPRPPTEAPPAAPPATKNVVKPAASARPLIVALRVLSLVCFVLLGALVYLMPKRTPVQTAPAGVGAAPESIRTFWSPFESGSDTPLAVFSNAEFVGRPETGMRYFDPARDSPDAILDHYTGIGEVLAIHELDRVFTMLNHGLRVKRGRLLSLDDAQNTNLIFIGSPSENLTLRVIPTTRDFVFRLVEGGPRKGDLGIFNLKPLSGEQAVYMGSKSIRITEDYALIALVPGKDSGRWVMILGGTTTIGTEAAVEYVCRERDVAGLLSRLGTSRSKPVKSFEAVIRSKVAGGVPISSELVALHTTGE